MKANEICSANRIKVSDIKRFLKEGNTVKIRNATP